MYGDKNNNTNFISNFEGIINFIDRKYSETERWWVQYELEKYLSERNCEICNGFRLNKKALSVKINGTIKWLRSLNQKHPDLYHSISEIFLTNNDEINLILAENPTKIMLGNNNTHYKIDLLKEFERTMGTKKEITDFTYLDMRYNNQVVVKE